MLYGSHSALLMDCMQMGLLFILVKHPPPPQN